MGEGVARVSVSSSFSRARIMRQISHAFPAAGGTTRGCRAGLTYLPRLIGLRTCDRGIVGIRVAVTASLIPDQSSIIEFYIGSCRGAKFPAADAKSSVACELLAREMLFTSGAGKREAARGSRAPAIWLIWRARVLTFVYSRTGQVAGSARSRGNARSEKVAVKYGREAVAVRN